MKKLFTLVIAVLLVCLTVFTMTSCGETEITVGDNGNWFIDGVDTGKRAVAEDAESISIGDNGNWFIDGVDTGKRAVAEDAESISIGDNGNWFIGSEDTGVKAVTGKYVVDVKSAVKIDNRFNKQYVVTEITYSDGTTEINKSELPKQIKSLSWKEGTTFYAGYAPALYIGAVTVDDEEIELNVTDDMFVGGKPDFNTPGTYEVKIAYADLTVTQEIRVLDASGVFVKSVDMFYNNIRKGTPFSEVAIEAFFSDDTSYKIWLSDCDVEGVTEFNSIGIYDLNLNYKGTRKMETVDVYDPEENNIQNILVDKKAVKSLFVYIPYNADADTVREIFNDIFVGEGKLVEILYYELMHGKYFQSIILTEDIFDLSTIDTSVVGSQTVKLELNIDGVGHYTCDIHVEVTKEFTGEEDVNIYTNDTLEIFGDMLLYEGGVAVLSVYDLNFQYTRNGNVVIIEFLGTPMYFSVDDETKTYDAYVPEGTPTAVYTGRDVYVEVYSDYVYICGYDSSTETFMPVTSTPISSIQNNEISFMGQRIVLYSDGTCEFLE